MSKLLQLLILFSTLLVLSGQTGFAQENEADASQVEETEEAAETTEAPAGQEVEINEDNYRQFMELRDARQQRNVLPENAFKPKSGSQKLDDLPEASQKHLRNQLREIIVQGDEWQPGDEGDVYSYVPSEAASTDQALQKKEAEAWGELVDSYHQREAEIYENGARTAAAQGNKGSQGGDGGNSQKPGGEQSGQGEPGENGQQGEEQASDQRGAADSYSPNASKDPNANSTSGVSQNAMEFLKSMAERNGGPGGAGKGNSNQDTGQKEQQGQMGTGQADPATSGIPSGGSSSNASDTSSTAGSSQSAMDYLKGLASQEGNTSETGTGDSTEGAEQQASQEQQTDSQSNSPGQNSPTGGESQDPTDSRSTEGATQNALDYLRQGDGSNKSENSTAAASDDGGEGQSKGNETGSESGQELAGQQSDEDKQSRETNVSMDINLNPDNQDEEVSTQGSSQNALEYLTGDTYENSNTGDSGQEPAGSEGTLSIQDLLNAQGVGGGVGTAPTSNSADGDTDTDPDKVKKDRDG